MRILHLCLACFYIDGYSYQENILPKINHEDGHEVKIVASTENYIDNKTLGFVEPSSYITEFGVPIVRLPYAGIGNKKIKSKLRFYKGLYQEIENFNPDIIMAHDLCFGSVSDVVKYVKRNRNVKFYADTHTASYNSGKNWISLNILHKSLYRQWIQRTVPYIRKYYYLSVDERDFSIVNYKFPKEKMEFYPLGGFPLEDEIYDEYRKTARNKLNIRDNELLFVHSGKLNEQKRTLELLRAFSSVKAKNERLIIAGSVSDDILVEFNRLVSLDKRIVFVGWKNSFELQRLLCAADLYLQPGTVSATMQNAICCRCPILSYPHKSYQEGFDYGQFIWAADEDQITKTLNAINEGAIDLQQLSKNAEGCAREILDYHVLAAKIY